MEKRQYSRPLMSIDTPLVLVTMIASSGGGGGGTGGGGSTGGGSAKANFSSMSGSNGAW